MTAQERCDAARRRWREEQAKPAVPGEPMVTVHTSHGQFQMPKRVADASHDHLTALAELRREQREQRRTFE
ncbi:MAG: hypothetical protein ACM358_11920 [Gemmatimonadota bacterium]